jgi:hypothetical protein
MKSGLTTLLTKPLEGIGKIVRNPLRRKEYCVNTFTPMPIFQTLFFLNEVYIGGAEIGNSLKTRAMNIGLAICLNDYLFRQRDRVSGTTIENTDLYSRKKQIKKDAIMGLAIAPLIYGGLMKAGGNDWPEIISSLPIGIALMSVATTVYLTYIHDPVRKFFGTHPSQRLKKID